MADITRAYNGYTIVGQVILDGQDSLKARILVRDPDGSELRSAVVGAAQVAAAVTTAKAIVDQHLAAVQALTTALNA